MTPNTTCPAPGCADAVNALRDPVLEHTVAVSAGRTANVFVYYPQLNAVWFQKDVAAFCHNNGWVENVPESLIPHLVEQEDAERFCALFERIAAGEESVQDTFVSKYLLRSFTVTIDVARRDAAGNTVAAVGRMIPVTEESATRRFMQVLSSNGSAMNLPDSVLMLVNVLASQYYAIYHFNLTDQSFICYQRQAHHLNLTGEPASYKDLWAQYIPNYVQAEDRDAVREFTDVRTLKERLSDTDRISVNYRRIGIGWVRATFIAVVRDTAGTVTEVLYAIADISKEVELREKAEQALYEAYHDSLTGLLTRKAYDNIVVDPGVWPQKLGLFLIDIDHFKIINDTYGHETGDRVLRQVSKMLSMIFDGKEELIRLGGDELAVILPDAGTESWKPLCQKLADMGPYLYHQLPDGKNITLSGGIAFTETGFTPELYTLADKGLYHTKSNGRAGVTMIGEDGQILASWRDANYRDEYSLSQRELVAASMDALMANTEEVAFVKNKDGVYITASDGFARLLGRKDAGDVIGKTVSDLLLNRALIQKCQQEDAHLLSGQQKRHTFQQTVRRADGTETVMHLTKYRICDRGGNPTGIFCTGMDITEQVRMEREAMSNAERKINTAISKLFFACNYIDLKNMTYRAVQNSDYSRTMISDEGDARASFEIFVKNLVEPAFAPALHEFFDPETLEARLEGHTHLDCEYISSHLHRWCRATLIPADRDGNGKLTHVLFTVAEIDRSAAEKIEAGISSQKHLKAIFDNVPGGIVLYRWVPEKHSLKPLFISAFYDRLYGDSLRGKDGEPDLNRIHPDDRDAYVAACKHALQVTHQLDYIFRVRNRETDCWEYVNINAVSAPQPDGTSLVYAIYTDVTEHIRNEHAALRNSHHDPLTGLYTRRKFFAQCRKLLDAHPEDTWAMLRFDIRQFRLYNTFFGEAAGDRLLCEIAAALRAMDSDYPYWAFARIEADVFACFFPMNHNKWQAHIEEGLKALAAYRDDFLIEPVIGVYTVTDREMPVEAMFARSTIAARSVQRGTESCVGIFSGDMENTITDTLRITNEMQAALDDGQFNVWLQPKIALEDGRITGAEALVRWEHPVHGLISPVRFIPVFENNGFILKLDRAIWENTCKLLRKWLDEGRTPVPVSVNVSRISMSSPATVPFLRELVNRYQLDPALLPLELTETAYMDDPEEMKRQLTELRSQGFRVLLDDFGAGYSSLNTLRDVPADELKLDIGFLPKDRSDARGCALVRSIVNMSRDLGLSVIAEGVETQAQADYLREFGCPTAQGYLFARPMPVAEFEALTGR